MGGGHTSYSEPFHHRGFNRPDPFAPRRRPGASFVNALLATTVFRCWHIIIFYAAWATLISVLSDQGYTLKVASTLLTVVGTILGFIISYRTTSSFERYNEGRRLWSQIIRASRTMARTIWFHVPNNPPISTDETLDHARARTLVEKKTVINLLEAFSVAVKHYLRGEDGIYYEDLYYLVKFLPAYTLPAGRPPTVDLSRVNQQEEGLPIVVDTLHGRNRVRNGVVDFESLTRRNSLAAPMPPTINRRGETPSRLLPIPLDRRATFGPDLTSPRSYVSHRTKDERIVLSREDESLLMPAHLPPKYGFFDIFPFSLLVRCLTERGREVKGKKGARLRAELMQHVVSHNLPLELTLYLSSYISALQFRKIMDTPSTNGLITSLNQLVDSLTGLERILTTPIPFSYSVHLWTVAFLYCLFLPFQLWSAFGWLTIPATVFMSFVYFGFLTAGEEIENPFGYDKNDLNLDHFTHNIIRNELRAVTSTPPPDPARWAFVAENNLLFSDSLDDRVTPAEWLERGPIAMQQSLAEL